MSAWLILADDLTGAADSAVAFAARGAPTIVGWGARRPDRAPGSVFAYDGDSRGLPAEAAADRRAELLSDLLTADCRLFAKIDSTLRGQPAAEIAATRDAVLARCGPRLGILAPAFPATGRTTVEGRVRVGGEPLESTEGWRRDHSYDSADLMKILAQSSVPASRISLETVRSRRLAGALAGDGVAVCDAETDADLDRIVAAGPSLPAPPYWIGSGGLAAALARAAPPRPAQPLAVDATPRGTLAVVGSPHPASRAAAARLAERPGLVAVLVDPEAPPPLPGLAAALEAGRDVLALQVLQEPLDLARGPALAEALALVLAPLAGHAGALVVTGGETASALLAAFGADGVRLAEEIEPGVSLGLTLGRRRLPVVAKSGAFGDEGVLLRAADRLARIRREGILA